jgi:hypothetical protein
MESERKGVMMKMVDNVVISLLVGSQKGAPFPTTLLRGSSNTRELILLLARGSSHRGTPAVKFKNGL